MDEGHIARLRFFGPEKNKVMAYTKPSAPGGERICKVRRLGDRAVPYAFGGCAMRAGEHGGAG